MYIVLTYCVYHTPFTILGAEVKSLFILFQMKLTFCVLVSETYENQMSDKTDTDNISLCPPHYVTHLVKILLLRKLGFKCHLIKAFKDTL